MSIPRWRKPAATCFEHYVEYWALRLRIDTASAAEIERFLKVSAGSAVGDRMRTDWLKQLGRTGDWVRFEQVGQGFDTDDSEIACFRATLAVRNGSKEVQPAPRGIWEDRLTEACADAFASLVRAKQLTAEDALWRFRTTADGGTLLAASRVADVLGDGVAPQPDACNARTVARRRCCVVVRSLHAPARGCALRANQAGP